jgi:hypothetical protein
MNIDLNLHNYTKQDIERLFGLSSPYTPADLQQKEQDLVVKLTKTQTPLKEEILSFLKSAKERLSIPPIVRTEAKRLLCIDSLFRPHFEGTKSSDFIYFVPEDMKNVVSMKLVSVELPQSWYLFSESAKNSTFYIKLGEITATFVIPDGNYTSEEMYTVLNSLLEELNEKQGIQLHVLLQPSKKFVFTCDTAFGISFVSKTPEYRNTCGTNLGFLKSDYRVTSFPYEIQAETMYGTNSDSYVFLEVNDFHPHASKPSMLSLATSSLGVTSPLGNMLMAKLPLTTAMHQTIRHDCLFTTRLYTEPIQPEKLQIRLLNKYGMEFNLHHSNYSLTLEMTQVY